MLDFAKGLLKAPLRPSSVKRQKERGAKLVSLNGNTPQGQDPEDGRIIWKKAT